jgi:PAP2 superfamily
MRLALLTLLSLAATGAAQAQDDRSINAVVQQHGIDAGPLRADVIVSWNTVAHDLAFAEDQFLTFKGQRALAMMHLAMHDALNTIVPIDETYAYLGRPGPGHPIAAAAQAAHDVLSAQYPTQRASLANELDRWLAPVPPGSLRDRGVATGRASAAAILARRTNDGWDVPGTYEFEDGAGRYQTTPPWNGFVAQPGFRFARPFVLDYPEQFRPSPPPPLGTKSYARALNEVKEFGAAESVRGTEDQTAYAIWWMEFAEGSVNRLARQLAVDRNMHLWSSARLFAQIGVALYDVYVATWDAKYTYDHWRPYTAIRLADGDDNRRTEADPAWTPLRPAPPFPDYTSAHAAACAASFGVLEQTFGRRLPFTMETTTAPPGMPTRTFDSFRSAAAECADSRVRLGFHFRYSTDAGSALGQQVARYVLRHSLRVRSR